jgi:hypothetical protein
MEIVVSFGVGEEEADRKLKNLICHFAFNYYYGWCGNRQILVGIHFANECHFLYGRCTRKSPMKPTGFVSGWPCQLAYSGIVWTRLL